MKILFVHKHSRLTGVSTFIYTAIKEITKLNVEVDLYVENPQKSIFIDKVKEICNVVDEVKQTGYDRVYFNYRSQLHLYTGSAKKYFFVHGLMDQEYSPDDSVDKIFCFGERSFSYIQNASWQEKVLIRNGLDLSKFQFKPSMSGDVKKILIFDSRTSNTIVTLLTGMCSRNNWYVSVISSNSQNDRVDEIWDVEERIYDADVVIAKGRSMFEAMACGKPVVNYGLEGGDGSIDSENFLIAITTNGSGWVTRKLASPFEGFDPSVMEKEIKKALSSDVCKSRKMIEEFYDMKSYVQEILS